MWEFIVFLRDKITDISSLLDSYSFVIVGMQISIFDMLIGILCTAFVVAVFWKGARA